MIYIYLVPPFFIFYFLYYLFLWATCIPLIFLIEHCLDFFLGLRFSLINIRLLLHGQVDGDI